MQQYKTVAVEVEQFGKLEAVKGLWEKDFGRRFSWSEFLVAMATGYCMGRAMILNEDKFQILLEEDKRPAVPSRTLQRTAP